MCALILSLLVSMSAAFGTYDEGLLDIKAVKAAAAQVTSERFPNADDVLVDDHIHTTYQADGTAVTYDDTVMKVLTEKGKRDNKMLTRHFVLPFSTASFTLVHVIKPDGTVVPVDLEAQSRVMVDRGQMGSNIYNPNSKLLRLTIPELEIGDLVRYVAKTELVKPRVPNTFSDYHVLEYTSPIVSFTYTLDGPEELPLRSVALKDEVEGTVSKTTRQEDGRIIQTWTVKNVPRMYREPNMPTLHTVVQRLLVSTIPDWEYLSRWYWELSEPHFEPTEGIRQTVNDLTEGLTDRESRLRAIFRFVSQEVRYMGITVETEAPGYEPHDVSMTFENRHGVCRDKAALLVVMLRLAGFEAFPVLIHNGPKKDEEVPQPYFNHAIAAASDESGGYTLMDPTDENTKDLFPAYLCNQSYLVARPEGATLRTSPIIPAADNMMHVKTTGRIDAQGNLSGRSVLDFDGINDNIYRGYFSRITPDERRRFFEGLAKSMAPGTRVTAMSIAPADLMNTDMPLRVDFSFRADSILVSDGATTMIPVPRLGNRVGMVNFILRDAGLRKRDYPFVNEFACGVEESLAIALDSAIGVPQSMPSYEPVDVETLDWTMDLEVESGTLTGKSRFAIETVEFSPEQYLVLKDVLRTLEVNDRKKPIFTSTDDPAKNADTVLLDSVREYDLTDEHSWTLVHRVRRKVLTYKGKKDHSELKWNYNPAWEEVELLSATVTTAGETKEISDQEINLMDAGWVGSAPRYPGAKTLVASLPGVEEGSVIEYHVRHTVKDRPFFSTRQFFRGFDPLERKMVRITTPKDMELNVRVYHNGVWGSTKEEVIRHTVASHEDGRTTYEWEATDQDPVKREDNLPPGEAFMPVLYASTGDWDDYAATLRAILTEKADRDDGIEAFTEAVVKDADGRRQRVEAIRDAVAKRIRKAGPGLGQLPLTAMSAAEKTMKDGYGHDADVAIMLYAMLKEAGMRPRFVLASAVPRVEEIEQAEMAYPSIGTFGTVLVAVNVPGLERVYLNDTNQYAPLGYTGHDGHLGLDLKGGRSIRIEAAQNRASRTETQYTVALDAEGTARITTAVTHFGGRFAAKKRQFEEMPPEERRRYYQETLSALSQGAEPDGDLVTSFDDYPGVESFTAVVPDFAVRDGDYLYFNLPESLANLLRLRSDTRSSPLYWPSPTTFRVRTRMTIPEGLRTPVLLPPALFWQAPSGAGSVWAGVDWQPDGSLDIIHDVQLQPAILPVTDYDNVLELDRQLSHPDARTVLFSAPADQQTE